VSGFVSATSGTTSLVITISGKISSVCLEQLKLIIANWAAGCGVTVSSVTTTVKPLPRKGKIKKKKGKKKPKKK
jgi:hypothetical protein